MAWLCRHMRSGGHGFATVAVDKRNSNQIRWIVCQRKADRHYSRWGIAPCIGSSAAGSSRSASYVAQRLSPGATFGATGSTTAGFSETPVKKRNSTVIVLLDAFAPRRSIGPVGARRRSQGPDFDGAIHSRHDRVDARRFSGRRRSSTLAAGPHRHDARWSCPRPCARLPPQRWHRYPRSPLPPEPTETTAESRGTLDHSQARHCRARQR